MSPLLYILILSSVTADIPTPSSLLGPKHYNHHAYEQYLKEVEPTKQGPILFPNDAPPPPRTPLIVTSRPLLDSIARSDLNNSVAEQSIISRVYQPQYFRQYDYENSPVDLQLLQLEAVDIHHDPSGFNQDTTGDRRAGSFLAQRISLAIQRGNAASIFGTMPQGPFLDLL
ncbi:hypothetical protein MSG28_015679 [Choristoneura fumiferana]|uniref:Uncharacterized protein n=1 Tax=Choristoneura fumiferana TaxID=7141 RepID=A0ACC0KC97_CHOFU|nr:hypothetical protein MSG28_015679 [Choristoneura fumiferana]